MVVRDSGWIARHAAHQASAKGDVRHGVMW